MRRGNNEVYKPSMEGGLGGGGVTGTRMEAEENFHMELGGASVVGRSHAPRLADRGDGSPTWVETNLTCPKEWTENLHKEGKVNLGEEKEKEQVTQISEKASSPKVVQPKVHEVMQWENATKQGSEPKFKFDMAPVQIVNECEIDPGKDEGPQGLVTMLFDAKVG